VPPRTEPREIVFLPERKIRCVLVYDHVLFRQGLRRLLEDEPDIEVVGEAGNASECLRRVFESRPDVVIADADTFGLSAVDSEIVLARESPQTKAVFLNLQEQNGSTTGGIRAARQTSSEELIKIIHGACQWSGMNYGEVSLSRSPQRASETLFEQKRTLTAREREVLKLLAEGRTVRAAAAILGLSTKTVDAHKFNLMRKLGIHNKAEMVMWAIQQRVVKIPANF
jgi:two-component system, NarL family, response regulator NreC